jgi:DNA-binding NarL/FixJ family response regulator/tetratricopeptide (TPR) repeat protein
MAAQGLLEREQELETLERALATARTSGGRIVLVRGGAGIGKTALIREFVTRHEGEATVLVGACDDLTTPQPLGPFWDMSRHEPTISRSLHDSDRPGLLNAILDLLDRSLRPTVIVVEDTQWADEATLDALRSLGRRIADTRGVLILTYRDGAVDFDHPLRAVIGEFPSQHLVRISLKGLSPDAVESMSQGTDLDPGELFALTDGNPLFVVELVTSGTSGVPASIQDSVLARAAKISPKAREALDLISVIPGSVEREVIDELVGSTEVLRECAGQGLLDVGDSVVAFRHELTRHAVESTLSPDRRQQLNHAVLKLLATVPELADPARLAHHADAAEDVESILKYAPVAARAAVAAGSDREAVAHFRMLRPHLELLDPDERGEVLEDWAEAESEVGNYEEAIGLVDAARRLYRGRDDRPGQSRTLARAAYYYEWAGERSHAEEHARQAIDVLGPDPDGKDLATALEVNAFLSVMGDSIAAQDLVDRIFDAAGSEIEEQLLVRCLIHRGGILDEQYPAGLEVFEEAIERARAAGLWQEEARALGNQAWNAVNFRDLTTAEALIKRSMAVLAEHSDTDTRVWSYANTTYAWILELKGEWSLAEDLAREQLEQQRGFVRTFALPILGRIEARQGRRVAAETLGESWELATRSDELQRLVSAAAAAAEYAWISGSEVVPVAELNQVLRRALEVGWPWPSGAIAFWLWHTGNLAEVPKSIAEPHRMMMSGEPTAAAQIWESLHCRYDAAIALSLGDSDAQIQATEVLETLGATAVAAKIRQQLRSQHVPVPRGRSHSTRTHPVGLTSRQNEVLHLLAEGLTNLEIADRLFLSPRTVENHVAAVISKLNAPSRDSAVAAALEKGLLEHASQATTT